MDCFTNKVALISGAAGGIGAATARHLARAGCRLVLTDRQAQPLNALAQELSAQGTLAWAEVCDLRSAKALSTLVEDCERRVGPVEYLVNAAGVLTLTAGLDATEDDWDRCFSVNARAVFLLTKQVGRSMRARQSGAIVTVSSNAAAIPRIAMAAYAASKAAATSITLSLGLELATSSVRCNVVSPGSTDTDMLRKLNLSHQSLLAGDAKAFRLGVPLNRIASPQDVARSIVFLLSDDAQHITLHDLRVDGGATLNA